MKRVKISKDFYLDELVSKETYDKYNHAVLKRMIQPIIRPLQRLRDDFSEPMLVNTWGTGGDRQYSGLRETNCKIGALYSKHKDGNTIDVQCRSKASLAKLFEIAKTKRSVKRIENPDYTPTWLHIEFGYSKKLPVIFNP